MNEKDKIANCWNSGMTLSQASKFMRERGFTNTKMLVDEWRKYKKKYGCAPIPNGFKTPPTEEQMRQYVGGGHTYGDWLGLTGPGLLMRQIIKNANESKATS